MGCGCLALIAIIVIALFTGVIGGLSFLASIIPKARINSFNCTDYVEFLNGAPDAGILVSFDLLSVSSDPQDVTVEMKVSCSEGQWTERQNVHLQPNETQHIRHFFAQPTIDAKDVHCHGDIVTGSK